MHFQVTILEYQLQPHQRSKSNNLNWVSKDGPEKFGEPEIFAEHDIRVYSGHQQSQEAQVLTTQGY